MSEGSFQAAAEKLLRAQPSVSTAVENLEEQLRLSLLDRSGYRVMLTPGGADLPCAAPRLPRRARHPADPAAQLAMGEENELVVVIGDLCPVPHVLGLLRRFFDGCAGTRLHLHVEAISGPWERLFDGEADLIIHHVDKADGRLERIDLGAVRLVPVAAPRFLKFPIIDGITPEQMRDYV